MRERLGGVRLIYFEHHLGDYLKDAGHLSLLEEGVYRRLLDQYYIREQPLPEDMKALYKLVRAATRAERKAVEYVLEQFFKLQDDGYHQGRADREIQRYRERAERARRNGKNGGRPTNKSKTQSVSSGIPRSIQGGYPGESYPYTSIQDPESSPQSPEGIDTQFQDTHSPTSASPSPANVERELFEQIKATYPAGTFKQSDWLTAEREIGNRLGEGEKAVDLVAGCARYAEQCAATGRLGTNFVTSPSRFFRERQHREPFPLPAEKTTATERLLANLDRGRRTYVPAPTVEEMEIDMRVGLRDSTGTWLGPRTEDGSPDYGNPEVLAKLAEARV